MNEIKVNTMLNYSHCFIHYLRIEQLICELICYIDVQLRLAQPSFWSFV